jgi:2-keto-4-pentenoate hydratase
MSTTTEIAERILAAYAAFVPIAPVRSELSGIQPAYAVQRACVDAWQRQGRRLAGHKIGLTSKAVQSQLGVDEPDFGTLFDDMVLLDGAVVAPGRVMQPRLEAEIAFRLGADLRGDDVTPEQVIAATDFVCPALEICGSRIADWNIRIEDTVADNASSALLVLSGSRSKPTLDALAKIEMAMSHNGQIVGAGRGDACLGNPALAVAWLAQTMTRLGDGLKAGDVIMSGALAKMVAAQPGSDFAADFGPFGSVSVHFAP